MTAFIKKHFLPLSILVIICIGLYREVALKGWIPLPADMLVGAYYPWLDYKWGYQVGVPVKNSLLSDVFSQFFTWKYLAIDLLKDGHWPLWNPYSFSGTPLLASYHSSTLFPANVLLLLPGFWGWSLFIFSSTLIASFGMYIYLNRYIKNSLICIIAGLVYALGGQMTIWVEFGTGTWAAALIPLILWTIDAYVENKKYTYLPFISLLIASVALAGHAQLLTYLLIIFPIYSVWKVTSLSSHRIKIFISLVMAYILGMGLSAIQLLPTIDFYQQSIRAEENYALHLNPPYGLSPFKDLIRLWAPDFFGHPVTGNDFSQIGYLGFSSFLGALTLPLIIPLLFNSSTSKLKKFYLILFILISFLAYNHPLSRYIFSLNIPLLTYSSATRLFFLINLSSAVLLAIGLTHLQIHSYRRISQITALLLIFLTIGSWAFIEPQFQEISFRNSIIPIGLLVIFITLLQIKLNYKLLIVCLLVIFTFDLGRYFRKHTPFVPSHIVFPDTPVTKFLQQQSPPYRIARQQGPLLPANTWMYYGIEAIEGYDPLRLLNYNRFFHFIENGHYLDKASRYSEIGDIANLKFLDALNVKYFLTTLEPYYEQKPLIQQLNNYGYQIAFQDGHTRIYHNPQALNRVYTVNRVTLKPDLQTMATYIEQPEFDPRHEAVLTVGSLALKMDDISEAKIENLTFQPNKIAFQSISKSNNFLVIANAYDPGWHATINQQPTRLYQVNGALQGIIVPIGKNQISLNYYPESFRLGLHVTVASAILLFLLPFASAKIFKTTYPAYNNSSKQRKKISYKL